MKAPRFEARNYLKAGPPLSRAEATEEAVRMLKHFPNQEIGIYRLVAIVRASVALSIEDVDVDGA